MSVTLHDKVCVCVCIHIVQRVKKKPIPKLDKQVALMYMCGNFNIQTHIHIKSNMHNIMLTCTHIHAHVHMHIHTVTYTHTRTLTITYLQCTYTHTHISQIIYTAPSGHILTKTELQVLRSLLATYSNEKLKEIQLSIGEKEAIHNITREEVERSLQQRGLEAIASGLKDNIEKGTVFLLKIQHNS